MIFQDAFRTEQGTQNVVILKIWIIMVRDFGICDFFFLVAPNQVDLIEAVGGKGFQLPLKKSFVSKLQQTFWLIYRVILHATAHASRKYDHAHFGRHNGLTNSAVKHQNVMDADQRTGVLEFAWPSLLHIKKIMSLISGLVGSIDR